MAAAHPWSVRCARVTIEAAKADSARNADAYATLVDQLTNILAAHGVRVDTRSFGARLTPTNIAA